ncbi:NAD-dependent epimerase/dehydratase family protein [Thalassospira australica]|uniref:NAD-dependent epimerase/dehydratase family protein n=1 Tax=Thalassospira australica TaxID=1528106 RepID=UPI00051A80FD|nr:NAD-dependent epimerase/dehydratase family protein [Thalassospira australica]
MRVFITGGTGLIGSAIIDKLIKKDHHVIALARSSASASKLRVAGASPLMGDITTPQNWITALPDIDAVIHAACDFSDQMPRIDANLLDHLIPTLHRMPGTVRFVYTGGVWSYPETKPGQIADETVPFASLPDFDWMIAGINRILGDEKLHGIIIHPGCVYATGRHGHIGLFHRAITSGQSDKRITIVGGDDINQPMVHTDDLADLYYRALINAKAGSSYIGVAINGVSNKTVAELIAKHFAIAECRFETISKQTAMDRLGNWAAGLAHHQHVSSAKAMRELGWKPKHLDIDQDIKASAAALTGQS